MTVPLAVLKSNMVTFNPPLDERKRQAIDRLGAGLVEKVRQTQQTKIKMQCIL